MKSTNKTFSRVSAMLRQARDLRKRRATIARSLEDVDAKIADIELEWNDLQKEISVSIFGMGESGAVTMTSADDLAPKNKKRIKRRAKKTAKRRSKKKSTLSREQIRAAAAVRDEKVFDVIKKTPGLNIHAISLTAKDGDRSQIQTSLKRLKKAKRVICIGTGRNAVYKSLGKKQGKKKGK